MGSYRLSAQAEADLEEIFDYSIATFGLKQAERYRDQLSRCFDHVAADPRLGKAIAGRSQTFFQYSCQRHGIFFTVDQEGIFVVRVLHLARDFLRHLPRTKPKI